MDKKILRAMFKNIAEPGEPIRPNLIGVHFEAERCYATDTHMLVIYNRGNEKFAGQTVAFNGDILKGKYPDVDRVVPASMPAEALPIDIQQLNRALKWHLAQPATKDDIIALGGLGLFMRYLRNILAVFEAANEVAQVEMSLNDPGRPSKLVSESLTAIIMPVNIDEERVDSPRVEGELSVISYESLINDYARNSWRKKEAATEMGWLQ